MSGPGALDGSLAGWLAGLLAGAAVLLLLPGTPAPLRRLAGSPGASTAARRGRRRTPPARRSWSVDGEVALLADLLGAALAAGVPLADAVRAVAAAAPGPAAEELLAVARALELGAEPAAAWARLGRSGGPGGELARLGRALGRASSSGAPSAATLHRLAEDTRERVAAEAQQRARQVEVRAVLPTVGCSLPAFVLLGVVPTVLGLAVPTLPSAGWP